MVKLCATPAKQNVPAAHGFGRKGVVSLGFNVSVPSLQKYPGGHSKAGADKPRAMHTKPAGQISGAVRRQPEQMWPVGHNVQFDRPKSGL